MNEEYYQKNKERIRERAKERKRIKRLAAPVCDGDCFHCKLPDCQVNSMAEYYRIKKIAEYEKGVG